MPTTGKAGSFLVMLLATAAMPAAAEQVFNRIATFPVAANLPDGADASGGTVSEIISVSEDGNTLIYTDALQQGLGFVDITDPAAPRPAGFVRLAGDPTSVKVVGNRALVGVVTSVDYEHPSGHLAVVDIARRNVELRCDLAGQPDSVATSPDRTFVAVAIENERDEDVNDGEIPQLPAGTLAILRMKDGVPDCSSLRNADLTGLAAVAADDPEPEFVDINDANEAVVTLQENNHIAVVDLASAKVTAHFSAGTVDLDQVDTEDDGAILPVDSIRNVAREPDAVAWLDDTRFVTADEGDYKGGSRTFTIFRKDGTVEFSSGAAFEHEVIRVGHYPEGRSDNKGVEPEGIAVGRYGDDRLIFVGSERASVVGVYRDNGPGQAPEFLQMLAAGIGPEGLLAIPERDLFVVANEEDLSPDGGVGAHVMIFAREKGPAAYPTIVSANGADGLPIGWGALSGLAADAEEPGRLYAVTDSAYGSAPRILTIDATQTPAVITSAVTVTRNGETPRDLDLEGIAVAGDGFWLATEGDPEEGMTNRLLRVSTDGTILEEIPLPAEIAAHATASGLEGVTVAGSSASETVWLAVQREWGDDPKGMTKLLSYSPADRTWGVVHYPLTRADKGWVGLSEITAVGDDRLILIERDNRIGGAARLKTLTEVSLTDVVPAVPGSADIPVVEKRVLRDLIPDLLAPRGYVVDKPEGFAVDAAGDAYLVTDNDGVDDSSGETHFIRLGRLAD